MQENHYQKSSHEASLYWASECRPRTKQVLMYILVICFGVQSALVYTDPSSSPPLNTKAIEGRNIWHQYNCQSCHQIYGFGGFFGPDLTNVSQTIAPQRLQQVLTSGSGLMPAFNLNEDEIAAINEYLKALNETGTGQAKAKLASGGSADPVMHLIKTIQMSAGNTNNQNIQSGFQLFMAKGCQGCHLPFGIPLTEAPDLFTVMDRLNKNEIFKVLNEGRDPKMPNPGLSKQQQQAVFEFIEWLNDEQSTLMDADQSTTQKLLNFWEDPPWWEFD